MSIRVLEKDKEKSPNRIAAQFRNFIRFIPYHLIAVKIDKTILVTNLIICALLFSLVLYPQKDSPHSKG